MSFSMFVTWVLLGVLGGVLAGLVMKRGGHGLKPDIYLGLVGSIGLSWIFQAIGMFPNAGIVAMAFVAFIGATIAIVAQRTLRPTERPGQAKGTVWRWGLGAALVAAVVWMVLGPSVQPAATATSVVEDKTYEVTPAAMKVKVGIVTGEVTAMKVTERVEQGSGRVVSPAKPGESLSEEQLGRSDRPPRRGKDPVHRRRRAADQARGHAVRADDQVRLLRQ